MTKARSSLLAFATVTFVAALSSAQTVDRSGVGAMVGAINAERARQNLPALASDPRLDAVAEGHSLDMARARFFSHTSPTTGQPAERVTEAGMSWTSVAENIAINQSPQAAQQSLVRSPGHYQNMVDPNQRSVGIGIVRHGDQVWVTQLFASLRGPAPAPAVTVPPTNTAPANVPDDDEGDEDEGDENDTGCGRSDDGEVAAAPVAPQAPVAQQAPAAPVVPAAPVPALPSAATMPWQSIPGLDQFLTGLGMTRQPVAPQANQHAPSHQVYVVQTPFGPVRVEVPGSVAAPTSAPAARRPAAAPAPRTHRRAPARGRVVQVDTLDV